MPLKPHSREWYDRLSQMQEGYYYPWRSTLSPFNGEDAYRDLVFHHLAADSRVLDVACGHGEFPLELAPHCREIVAYDRIGSYVKLAIAAAAERGAGNATFICADSLEGLVKQLDEERPAFDLIISRRGPLSWLTDVRRVAREGTIILQLNPEHGPTPSWNELLPEPLKMDGPREYTRRERVEWWLGTANLALHSCWTFDVPEYFPNEEELYNFLSWGYTADEVPAFSEVKALLADIYARHSGPEGLAIMQRRFLWRAIVS